jgi:multisubunit Na+/H+ antiporter MnhG subunit
MVILRKAIVLVGVTCVLLTAFGIVDLSDDDYSTTSAMALTAGRGAILANVRGKTPSLIPIAVAFGTTLISRRRMAEGVFDLATWDGRSNLQSLCLLRC